MNKGFVQVYCGGGKGKTTAALGQGIRAASQGKSVIIIQFLKRKNEEEIDFIRRLEPEIKLFRFEKNEVCFDELDDDSKNEEIMNIKNGMNFADVYKRQGVSPVRRSHIPQFPFALPQLFYNAA